MLYHIPIEPYETRYTAEWIETFESAFEQLCIPYTTILGTPVTSKIGQGSVLDACGTHIYKLSQLTTIIEMINNGEIHDNDVLFFNDLWFPGIESLFYIRNITGIKFKVAGILHAGTYDPADFTTRAGMRKWGKYLEQCWLQEFDMIFLATTFHKTLILNNTNITDSSFFEIADRMKVTGIPFYAEDFTPAPKENIVVFPHRPDVEKHPELFDAFSKIPQAADYKFIKTIEATKSRAEYFDLMARSKIMLSFADQETFGYSTLEAMALGNVVIVPNKLSYRETVPEEFRYNTLAEAEKLFLAALAGELKPNYPGIYKWSNAITNMYKEMVREGWNV